MHECALQRSPINHRVEAWIMVLNQDLELPGSERFIMEKRKVVRMLPDTLQNLPRDERYAYARLLAYMARVDEEITVDELAMFEQQLGKALLHQTSVKSYDDAQKPPRLKSAWTVSGLKPVALLYEMLY